MLNRDSSTAPTASTRRRERHSARAATNPTTAPARANFVPSHGSSPSSAKQPKARRREGCTPGPTTSRAAPARAAAAVSSGYTALPYARNGGLSPTARVAPTAQGSGTTRSASR